jgi:uncharacterized OB-fold protein
MPTTEYSKPLPKPTETDKPYWDGLKDHQLLIQFCPSCSTYQWYPRAICANCAASTLQFRAVQPRGTVFTFTVQHHATGSRFDAELPFATVVVALSELSDVRVTGLFVGDPTQVHIGMPVEGHYRDATEDVSLLVFSAAQSQQIGSTDNGT